jgi:hypothetical protein
MGKKGYYLTDEEYCKFTDSFFQVESTIRILKENSFEKGHSDDPGHQNLLDVANCLEVIQEKLEVMAPLLGK